MTGSGTTPIADECPDCGAPLVEDDLDGWRYCEPCDHHWATELLEEQ